MTVSQPDITINIVPAQEEISNEPQRVLFIGQKLAAGTKISGALVQNIQNNSEEDTFFGEGSLLAAMVRAGRKVNKNTQFDAIPLDDDGGAVKATGTVVFSGTATASGTLEVVIGSSDDNTLSIVVASGDSATVVGDALVTALTADTKALVTGINTTGSVALTANNGGEEGNTIGIRVIGTVAGVTSTVTGMASGAGNPSLTTLFDVITERRYQTIIWPSTFTLSTLTTELDARFNVTNDVLDGVGIQALSDTFSNLQTTGNAENSRSLVLLALKVVSRTDYAGPNILELPATIAAQLGSIRALRLTPDANLSQFVITPFGARDQFGGVALATLPYFNTPFPDLPQPDVGDVFTRSEIEQLGDAGVSVISGNIAQNAVIAGEMVTTRKTDSAGNPEKTFKFLNAVDAASAAREFFFNNLRARFVQSRLVEGPVQSGRAMANATIIGSFLDGLFTRLGGEDFVIVESGPVALRFFKDNRVITIDKLNGKASIDMQVPIVTQLRTILATMQIVFSTE